MEGDDLDEPITDAARSILDGHIVLSRKLVAQGHYPAVDVSVSVSRLFREVTTSEHRSNAVKLRTVMATYAEIADLIQIGAYKPGASPQVDRAVQLMPAIRQFLRQKVDERSSFSDTLKALDNLGKTWTW